MPPPQDGGEGTTRDDERTLGDLISAVSEDYDADVVACVAVMYPPLDRELLAACRARENRRKNALVILSTPGGSADVAYRIGRHLQRAYRLNRDGSPLADRGEVIFYVHDFCKSAGTILALGADRIIMSQSAELGPIDVQLRKEDKVGERTSGLTPLQALETLQVQAGQHFRRFFRQMRFDESLRFSTKMSADLAAQMTSQLMNPIYGQIDPIRLGEVERFVRISSEYGERLRTSNVKQDTVERLVSGFPSHEFVIDREEARQLFEHVDAPSDDLEKISEVLIRNLAPEDDNLGFVGYVDDLGAQEDDGEEAPETREQQDDADRSGNTSSGDDDGQVRPDSKGQTPAAE